MGLIERIQQFGLAGFFSVTLQLVFRIRELRQTLKELNEERECWQRQYLNDRKDWERRLDEERTRSAATVATLQAEQAKLLAHFAGVTAAESIADSPSMEEALEKLLQKQMLDPLSARIQAAQDEDTANFLFHQEEEQAAIRNQLSDMAANAAIPIPN